MARVLKLTSLLFTLQILSLIRSQNADELMKTTISSAPFNPLEKLVLNQSDNFKSNPRIRREETIEKITNQPNVNSSTLSNIEKVPPANVDFNPLADLILDDKESNSSVPRQSPRVKRQNGFGFDPRRFPIFVGGGNGFGGGPVRGFGNRGFGGRGFGDRGFGGRGFGDRGFGGRGFGGRGIGGFGGRGIGGFGGRGIGGFGGRGIGGFGGRGIGGLGRGIGGGFGGRGRG